MNLISLPEEVLEHVFSFLSFESVAANRVVCRSFNDIGKRVLNKGFYSVQRYNAKSVKEIKNILPRRVSERRSHPLAQHHEVLIELRTRINMLGMTYSKWIMNNMCCFIPGKVLDEIYRVIRVVLKEKKSFRTGIMIELRDLSSMAIEHFDEKILPGIRRNYYESRDAFPFYGVSPALYCSSIQQDSSVSLPCSSVNNQSICTSTPLSSSSTQDSDNLRWKIRRHQHQMVTDNAKELKVLKKEVHELKDCLSHLISTLRQSLPSVSFEKISLKRKPPMNIDHPVPNKVICLDPSVDVCLTPPSRYILQSCLDNLSYAASPSTAPRLQPPSPPHPAP